ncbi:cell division control protein 14 [Polyrhizophydium stewartii]|uniref:protein-tyrosine-phosphatase n=1 Tax=Polyrhizophydium stewartii TaxID=2732419 RepID=A0ABR4N801_9FUNG
MPFSTLGGLLNHATSATGNDILASAREFVKDKLYFTSLNFAPPQYAQIHFFSIDTQLVYINFYSDFGPSNLSHVMRFCEMLQEKFRNPATANKKICLYSSMDMDKRANAAFLICAYMVIVQKRTPEEAYQPLMGLTPPFVPYRDAGYGAATYHITVLDCIRGLHKALTIGLLDLENFDLEEYEFYEKVENGDFNWITSKFLALASPKDDPPTFQVQQPMQTYQQQQPSSQQQQSQGGAISGGVSVSNFFYGNGGFYLAGQQGQQGQQTRAGQPQPQQQQQPGAKRKLFSAYSMDNLVRYMQDKGIKTIIRLNNKTYDKRKILEGGIEHIELYFPDGTTPPDGILKRFLEICESREGPIAVHCKAGLGRTGTLIASYLMKHYKLTACETISFMRVVRPGSVVGPQQNYLQAMQTKLWKMHPASRLPPAVSCWKPSTYPHALNRFGAPVFANPQAGSAAAQYQQQQQQQQKHQQSQQQSTQGMRIDRFGVGASQDTIMADANDAYSMVDETRREVMMIRGGYANVDAYEAELEREREQNNIALDELLIPVQPRKAQPGAAASNTRASGPSDAWRRSSTSSAPPTSQAQSQQTNPVYSQARYVAAPTPQHAQLQQHNQQGLQQQQHPRYNLRSHSSTGYAPAGNPQPRAVPRTIQAGHDLQGDGQSRYYSQDEQAMQVHQQVVGGPGSDGIDGFVLMGGRIASPSSGGGRK